jgi:hypothetical protein
MFWHGGSSYAMFDTHNPKDAEEFPSMRAAVAEFRYRMRSPYGYPCVEGAEAWIFKGPAADNIGGDYPDWIMSTGPRGGAVVVRP